VITGLDPATKLINGNEYGKGTAIFTRDGGAARKFASSIRVDMVRVNVPIPVAMAFHSLGGRKHSLFDEMAVPGMESVRFYTRSLAHEHPRRRRIPHAHDAMKVPPTRRSETTCR